MPISKTAFEDGKIDQSPSEKMVETYRRRIIRKCTVCLYEGHKELEEKFYRREITMIEIAAIVGCSEQAVSDHFKHLESRVTTMVGQSIGGELAKQVTNSIQTLIDSSKMLCSRIERANDEWDIEPRNEQAFAGMLDTLRRLMVDMSKLKGEFSEPSVQITYNQQFNQLQALVLTQLCDDCRNKVIRAMNIEELVAPIT